MNTGKLLSLLCALPLGASLGLAGPQEKNASMILTVPYSKPSQRVFYNARAFRFGEFNVRVVHSKGEDTIPAWEFSVAQQKDLGFDPVTVAAERDRLAHAPQRSEPSIQPPPQAAGQAAPQPSREALEKKRAEEERLAAEEKAAAELEAKMSPEDKAAREAAYHRAVAQTQANAGYDPLDVALYRRQLSDRATMEDQLHAAMLARRIRLHGALTYQQLMEFHPRARATVLLLE